MKQGKHFLMLLLVAAMLCGMFSPAVLSQSQEYAYDTLFDADRNLTVAYLGGSITEGAGANASQRWTTLLTRDFFNGAYKTKYGTGTATEVNAGIGGTPSDLGLFRLANDVSSSNPDIVFVEFAVNDAGTAANGDAGAVQVQQRMEGIVRQLQNLPKQPVIIFIYTAAWKEDTNFDLPLNCAKVHQEVADYYGIGSINLCEYVAGGIDLDGNPIVWNKDAAGTWTGDNTHPNATGYAKYAQYIQKELTDHPEKYLKRITERELPKFGYEYGSPAIIAASDTSRASYSDGDWQLGGTEWPFRSTTDKVMCTLNEGATAEFTFTGRSIGLYVLRGDRGNSAEYTITNDEGTVVRTGTVSNHYRHASSYNSSSPKGTTMACSTMLMNGLPYDNYTLSLTTNAITIDSVSGYTKNLFAIGYYMVDETAPAVEAPAYVKPKIDISKTDTSLSREDTAYVQVTYTDTLGESVLNSDTEHVQGVVYESSNPSVLSIDENGFMTPIQEGTSFISVSYNGYVSQKLMVIVYNAIGSVNKTWDDSSLGTDSQVLSSAQDGTLKFTNTFEVVTGGHESETAGQSIHYFPLDKDTMGYDDYAKGDFSAWSSGTNWVMHQITGAASAADQASVLEMWFYDDGKAIDNHFWLSGIRAAGVSDAATLGKDQDLRHTFRMNSTGYYTMSLNSLCGTWASKEDYYNAAADQKAKIAADSTLGVTMTWAPPMTCYNNAAARSEGWHQFIWDATQDYTARVYVDGIMIGEIDTTELGIDFINHQAPAVRFDRMYDRKEPNDQEMIIDNITLYGTKSTGASISGLEVCHNKTSYALGETGKLTAKGVLANGTLMELSSEQVTFSTMDDTVISLSEDGTVLPVGVGIAKVTVTSGEYSQILNIIVHQPQTVIRTTFDDMASASIGDCYSAQNSGRIISNSYEFISDHTRTGSGLALHLKNIKASEMANDTFKTYLTDALNAGTSTTDYMRYSLPGIKSANSSERGLAEVWFYDTKEITSRQQFWITGYRTDLSAAVNCDTMRFGITFGSNTYNGFEGHNAEGYPQFTKYSVPRTKGWHQILIDYTKEDTYTFYIDGQILATRTAEGWNGGLSSVCFDRFVRAQDMSALTDDLLLQMYIDDCAVYDMSWSDAPVLASAEITDLDVTQTITYLQENETGQIEVKAVDQNGNKFKVTGDSALSYTVSDSSVLTVDEAGKIEAFQAGYALVTVTATGANGTSASKKLIIAVGNNSQTVLRDANNSSLPASATNKTTYAASEYSKEIYRTGTQSYHMLENHLWNDRTSYSSKTAYSAVFSGWLYDEGVGSASTPMFELISDNPGGKTNMSISLGINNTTDLYYQINNTASNRATWAPGATSGNLGATNQYTGNYFSGLTNGISKTGGTGTFTNPVTGTVTTYPKITVGAVERSKGWHQFAVVIDGGGTSPVNVATPNGKIEFYIDGELVLTDRYVPAYIHGFWPRKTGYISDYQVTHYAVERQAPAASNVASGTEGNLIVQTAYTASADTTDPNGYDQEILNTYGWEISDNGRDGWRTVSEGAEYTPAEAEKYLRAFAEPVGAIDGLTGEKAYSEVKQVGVANPKLTFSITGSGSVEDSNQQSYQNGEVMTTENGDTVTLTLIPATGYIATSVKAGDKTLPVSNDAVTLENMNLDLPLTVVFTEKEKEKPSAIANNDIMIQNDYSPDQETAPGFSAVLYSSVNTGYGYDILETGMKLINENGDFLLLPIMGTWSDTYQYGVRVFGEGITQGSYKMIPYLKIKDSEDSQAQDEYIYGDEKEFSREAE